MSNWISLFLICCVTQLAAIERAPWMETPLTAEVTLSQERISSTKVKGKEGTFHKKLHNNITTLDVLVTPLSDLAYEAALSFNQSQKYSYNLDALKLGIRKQWLNDLVADRISLSTGAVFTLPYWGHLRDLSSQNHGKAELELNCAIGKEFAIEETRYWQAWGAAYIGQAVEGYPWLGTELHLGVAFHDTHLIDLFCEAEKGFGKSKLSRSTRFRSWSHMDYGFVDLGLRYTYQQTGLWQFYGQAAHRVAARFCPQNVLSLELGLMIPFGL